MRADWEPRETVPHPVLGPLVGALCFPLWVVGVCLMAFGMLLLECSEAIYGYAEDKE